MRGGYETVFAKGQSLGKSQSMGVLNLDRGQIKQEIKDAKYMPTMREIKYLFEKLVGNKYEKEMKPDYEKQLNEDLKETPKANPLDSLKEEPKTVSIPRRSMTQKKMDDFKAVSKMKLLEFAEDINRNKPEHHKHKEFKLSFKYGAHSERNNTSMTESEKSVPSNIGKDVKSTFKKLNNRNPHEKRLSKISKIVDTNLSQKNIHSGEEVVEYYNENGNYQDDIPFDLYNMVELAKRVAKPYTIPKISELNKKDREVFEKKLDITKNTGSQFIKTDIDDNSNELNMIINPLKYMNKKINIEPIEKPKGMTRRLDCDILKYSSNTQE